MCNGYLVLSQMYSFRSECSRGGVQAILKLPEQACLQDQCLGIYINPQINRTLSVRHETGKFELTYIFHFHNNIMEVYLPYRLLQMVP